MCFEDRQSFHQQMRPVVWSLAMKDQVVDYQVLVLVLMFSAFYSFYELILWPCAKQRNMYKKKQLKKFYRWRWRRRSCITVFKWLYNMKTGEKISFWSLDCIPRNYRNLTFFNILIWNRRVHKILVKILCESFVRRKNV